MEVESEEEADQGDDEKADSTEDSESEETKVDKPKKTETVTTYDWEEINSNVAIWTRDKDEVTPEEYQAFWKIVSKEQHTKAIRWNHFVAEGNINFKSLLYLPEETPDSYRFGNIDKVEGGLKLYVRKVLISDEFDLMPRYLGFVRGVVDSDDLPLNVNRETLQETKIIKIIKKKLVRKVIDMIRAFANEPLPDLEEKEVEVDADGNVIDKEKPEPKEHPYLVWYKKFNANLKMGVIEDDANRAKLSKLLRFQTSKSKGEWVSLDHYISGMKDWQKEIYFLAGASLEEIEKSPFLERFNEKEIDVLFLTDAIDEYMLQQVRDYNGKRFSAISSENVKIDDEDADLVKRREKAYKSKFKPLTKWLKKLYGSNIMRVSISKRLGKQPAIVSSSEYGHSANMDRIMRAQAYQSGNDNMMRAMKVS
jgi:heat shock protein 90kDa beta